MLRKLGSSVFVSYSFSHLVFLDTLSILILVNSIFGYWSLSHITSG